MRKSDRMSHTSRRTPRTGSAGVLPITAIDIARLEAIRRHRDIDAERFSNLLVEAAELFIASPDYGAALTR